MLEIKPETQCFSGHCLFNFTTLYFTMLVLSGLSIKENNNLTLLEYGARNNLLFFILYSLFFILFSYLISI